ncbi:amidohydrolase [Vineibacter terrae]|uniref:Amidohydrolase n=1 Tax=Vineibacter terrae TaxID=2586908 RepID=A0A5C8PF77_9HYPH|nr:amidohydrolase family protein [Vineibacter terrae]TXL72307.1 amidohydrolase [Vineibacter terrae]
MSDASAVQRISNDFLPVRPDWLARHAEPVIEPDLPIVDPHHHLMDSPGHRYLLPEFLDDAGSGHRLVASLFVECRVFYRPYGADDRRSLGETEFVNGVAAMGASGAYGPTRACAGIIGNVDLRFGDRAGPALEAHVAAAGGRFRGIRNVAAWHKDGIKATTANPPQGLLLRPDFRQGFAWLARLGLTFDAWLLHTQLGDLIDLARAFPDTTIICDHIGGPAGIGPYAGRRSDVFTEWETAMRTLSRCPNVNVKLGGMGMHVMGFDFHMGERPVTSEVLADGWRPYVDVCLDAFGPDRAMFESNFPVDKGSCSWVVLWNAFKRLASGMSADEKRALFMGTACRVYGLNLAAQGIAV